MAEGMGCRTGTAGTIQTTVNDQRTENRGHWTAGIEFGVGNAECGDKRVARRNSGLNDSKQRLSKKIVCVVAASYRDYNHFQMVFNALNDCIIFCLSVVSSAVPLASSVNQNAMPTLK